MVLWIIARFLGPHYTWCRLRARDRSIPRSLQLWMSFDKILDLTASCRFSVFLIYYSYLHWQVIDGGPFPIDGRYPSCRPTFPQNVISGSVLCRRLQINCTADSLNTTCCSGCLYCRTSAAGCFDRFFLPPRSEGCHSSSGINIVRRVYIELI